MQGPLAGLRVLDLTINVLGPCATQLLGDAGADVIKIESPKGDPVRQLGPARSEGMGSIFLNLNRSKRSIVLDLKTEDGRATLLKLVETADIFVHSMRPDTMERLRLAYADVTAVNPQIIYASASGFRLNSSLRNRGAYDDVVQGLTGLTDLNRGREGDPRYFPTAVADKLGGYVLAMAITMAVCARYSTRRGQEVHVPMVESVLAFSMIEHLWGMTLQMPEIGVGYERQLSPDHRPYPTRDGHICLLAVTDDQWRRLLPALGRADLVNDARFTTLRGRTANLGAVFQVLEEALITRKTSEWGAILDSIDIPNGPANSISDLLTDTYLVETGFFQRRDHPTEGPMIVLSSAPEFLGTPVEIRRLAPRLGEHTREVLGELRREAACDAAPG